MIECLPYVVPPDTILAQHYFIPNSAGGISPIWDFRATPRFKGVDDAVFVGKVLSNTTSADPTRDIALLHLGKVSGDILDEAYRIFTVGGVPPSSVSFLVHGRRFSCLIPWTLVLTHLTP